MKLTIISDKGVPMIVVSKVIRKGSSLEVTGKMIRTCVLPGSKSRQNIVFLDEYPDLVVNDFIRSILTAREIDVLTLVARGMQKQRNSRKAVCFCQYN